MEEFKKTQLETEGKVHAKTDLLTKIEDLCMTFSTPTANSDSFSLASKHTGGASLFKVI